MLEWLIHFGIIVVFIVWTYFFEVALVKDDCFMMSMVLLPLILLLFFLVCIAYM